MVGVSGRIFSFTAVSISLLVSSAGAVDLTQATGKLSALPVTIEVPPNSDLVAESLPLTVREANGNRTAKIRFKSPRLVEATVIFNLPDGSKVSRNTGYEEGAVLLVPMNQDEVDVKIIAIDSFGKIYQTSVTVRAQKDSIEQILAKKWRRDIGLGFSNLDYSETVGASAFKVSEIGVTVKAGLNYQASKKWEVGGNAFFTLYPFVFKLEPAGIEPARWYGANIRGGPRVAKIGANAALHFLAGYYVWGMLTNSYGVVLLGGPQVFATLRFNDSRLRSVYIKFATIQDGFGVSSRNREIAAGAAFLVSKRSAKRDWMVTLDLANAEFNRAAQSFKLNSVSLGIGTSF